MFLNRAFTSYLFANPTKPTNQPTNQPSQPSQPTKPTNQPSQPTNQPTNQPTKPTQVNQATKLPSYQVLHALFHQHVNYLCVFSLASSSLSFCVCSCVLVCEPHSFSISALDSCKAKRSAANFTSVMLLMPSFCLAWLLT